MLGLAKASKRALLRSFLEGAGVQVRAEMGIKEGIKLVVLMYGGHTPGSWRLHADSLPPNWRCIVCSGGQLPEGMQLPSNFVLADKDAYTPDLVGYIDFEPHPSGANLLVM